MNIRRKKQPSLSDLDQFNNFCKAMAEQELFEAGVFPNAKDAGDVHDELTRLARPSLSEEKHNPSPGTTTIEASVTSRDGHTSDQHPGETTHQDRHTSPEPGSFLRGLPKFHLLGLSVVPGLDILLADPKPLPSGTSEEQQTPEKEPVKKSPAKKD